MTQPWIRKVELLVGAVPDWTWSQTGPPAPEAVTITSDGSNDSIRIRFRIQKHGSGYAQNSTIEVYNLGPALRSTLVTIPKAGVILRAGWEAPGPFGDLFVGSLQSAFSRRDGADIITTLCCTSEVSSTISSIVGTSAASGEMYFRPEYPIGEDLHENDITFPSAIFTLASQYDGVTVDRKNIIVPGRVIGPRGFQFYGSVKDGLTEMGRVYGFRCAVIDRAFYAVADGYYLGGQVVDINSDNGFLLRAEPVLDSSFQHQVQSLVIQSLLCPVLIPNGVVNLTSHTNDKLSGSYIAMSLTHEGDTHSNQWQTTSFTDLVNMSTGG